MGYLCTIMYQDESNETFQYLIGEYPDAACHDKVNRLFCIIDPRAKNPIIVADLLPDYVQEYNEEGEPIGQSYIDALVEVLGPILYAEDRTRPIHILKSVLSQLYRHPVYQQYIQEAQTGA